jgi:hypothetical protein
LAETYDDEKRSTETPWLSIPVLTIDPNEKRATPLTS